MRSPKKRRDFYLSSIPAWTAFLCFIVISDSVRSSSARIIRDDRNKRNVDETPTTELSYVTSISTHQNDDPDPGSAELTLITPLNLSDREYLGKPRRIIKRRRRKKVPVPSHNPVSIESATIPLPLIMRKSDTGETDDEKITTTFPPSMNESMPISYIRKHRPYRKKQKAHKIPEVWRVQNLNLDNVVVQTSDNKPSFLDKRESSEKMSRNNTGLRDIGALVDGNRDLNYDESNNPFLNSSTPISNELQNSLQFTLQMLHPLLNEDSVVSDNEPKVPENKTVALLHTLSDTVAQSPFTPDVALLPTHLRKKHPLLTTDSIGDGGNGPSKTGIRTSINPTYKTKVSTERSRVTVSSPEPTSESPSSSTTGSQEKASISSSSTTAKPTTTIMSTTRRPPTRTTSMISTTTKEWTTRRPITRQTTTTASTPRVTTQISTTTTNSPRTTKIITTPQLTTTTSSPRPVTVPFDLDHILGILNITELENADEKQTKSTTNMPPKQEDDQHRHITKVLMHPVDPPSISPSTTPKGQIPSTHSTTSKTSANPNKGPNSREISSLEQQFVEQLLGITNPTQGPTKTSNNATPNTNEGDSGEQILQLFNTLLQNQLLSQPTPKPLENKVLAVTTPNKPVRPNNSDLSAETNALLQSLILSSLKPQTPQKNNNNNLLTTSLFNFDNLLSLPSPPTTTTPTTIKPKPSTTTPKIPFVTPSLKTETGLSDAELKSIFELLDSASSQSGTTSNTAAKPSPVTTPKPLPPQMPTTTLHPALQSMLNLFKPFQTIPSPTTFIQPKPPVVSTTTTQRATTSTTKAPASTSLAALATSTINSLDLLAQLLGGNGMNKVNPVRSTPAPTPEFSLSSLFGGGAAGLGPQLQSPPKASSSVPQFNFASLFNNNAGGNNLFSPPQSQPKNPLLSSESNQLLNIFSATPSSTPTRPNGLYYWLDMNAFLGGDSNREGQGIRPKIGNKFPFIKISK